MKKCVLLFALFIAAILLFKMDATNTKDELEQTPSKELVSLSEGAKVAKN